MSTLNPMILRIGTAFIAGIVLVVGAYLYRDNNPASTPSTDSAVAVVSAPDRAYIDIVDSDNNGIPDWQESLQTTEVIALDETKTEFTPANTVTEEFALEFFEGYIGSKQYGAFSLTPAELLNQSSDKLVDLVKDEPITRSQITITNDTSVTALATYGEAIARITNTMSDIPTENELVILERAIQTQNEAELTKLEPIISYYTLVLEETLRLPVPAILVREHLTLLNSYQAILLGIQDMKLAFNDPMKALLRIQRYSEDVLGMNNAIANLYNKLVRNGASWEADSIVFTLISLE